MSKDIMKIIHAIEARAEALEKSAKTTYDTGITDDDLRSVQIMSFMAMEHRALAKEIRSL